MYSIYDYAYNGILFLNNILRPHHKRLSQLMIYSTTRCQSRCKHCSIWQKKVENLSFDDIKTIMKGKCVTQRTTVGLEGGEFILHPQANEIMSWFQEHHPNALNITLELELTRMHDCSANLYHITETWYDTIQPPLFEA